MRALCSILLAAGQGSRYRAECDADKLLVPCRRGECASAPVIIATLRALQGIAERTVVVVRADNGALIERLHDEDCQLLRVHTRGLGHSLAQAVARHRQYRGWLVALGDMPYVERATLRRIADQIVPERLVVPRYQGRRGHPRGIGRDYLDALLALDGDRGAQALFARHKVVELPLDDPGILRDIDRPADRLD